MDKPASKAEGLIIVRLLGGLGNQMFQYALGRHLSIIHGRVFKLDLSAYNAANLPTRFAPRTFGLGAFNIESNNAVEADIAPFQKYLNPSFYSRLIRRLSGVKNYYQHAYIHEPRGKNFTFDSNLLSARLWPIVYLDGFWQTEKYFKPIEDLIRKDFTFRYPPNLENSLVLAEISAEQSVGIHIRHGDNATKIAEKHGVLPVQYYQQAVKLLSAPVPKPHFFVFSDNPVWAKQNLKLNFPCTFVTQNSVETVYEDLRLMAACKHQIIGNSTFSWWAAWLGKKPGQHVYAPARYHMNANIPTTDLYPAGWNLINI